MTCTGPATTTNYTAHYVAGTMTANGSGLQGRTLLNIALAWILTLPAAMAIAGSLYFILRHLL